MLMLFPQGGCLDRSSISHTTLEGECFFSRCSTFFSSSHAKEMSVHSSLPWYKQFMRWGYLLPHRPCSSRLRMVEKKACRKSLCPTGYSRKSTCIITDIPDSLHDSAALHPNAGHNQIPMLQARHEQAPALFLGGSVDKALQARPVGKCDGQIAVAAQPGSGDCDL